MTQVTRRRVLQFSGAGAVSAGTGGLIAITAIVASLLLTSGNTALGQTGDAQPDGNGHPNVGAFLLPRLADGSLRIICSGTLVTPRVFLTASHCTAFALSQGSRART